MYLILCDDDITVNIKGILIGVNIIYDDSLAKNFHAI